MKAITKVCVQGYNTEDHYIVAEGWMTYIYATFDRNYIHSIYSLSHSCVFVLENGIFILLRERDRHSARDVRYVYGISVGTN